MPKLKTRKAAAKRFKATGSGKFLRRRAFRSHLLDHKSPKRKRYLGTMAVVDERDADNVSAMLPYAGGAARTSTTVQIRHHLIPCHGPRQEGQRCPQTP